MVNVAASRQIVSDLLKSKDRSAYILSRYVPERAQNLFLGLRGFNFETQKVVDSTEKHAARLRLEFWKSAIQQIHSPDPAQEPVTTLLQAACADGLPVAKRYLLTMVQTREQRVLLRPLRSIEDMERYGEGTVSQMHYCLLEGLNKVWPETGSFLDQHPGLDESVTNVCAHIGQAAGIAGLLRSFEFYCRKHFYVNLPVDLLTQANISQQTVLDAAEENSLADVPGLLDVVFDTATRANDHILTARSIMSELKTGVGVPPSLLPIGMTAVPIVLYLEHLEKVSFNLGAPSWGEWKLPWRLWRAHKRRLF